MSNSKTQIGIYFDLMYLIGTEKAFVRLDEGVPDKLFTNYLKIAGIYNSSKEKIINELKGVSKKQFQEIDWPDVDTKVKIFSRQLKKFDTTDGILSNYYHFENEFIQTAYEHYCYRTGHIHDRPISAKILSDEDSDKMEEMMMSIGSSIVERSVLEDVKEYLEFNDFYSRGEVIEFDSVADACWEFYNENESITQEEVLFKIEYKSHFTNYAHLSIEEAKKKALKAAKQWFRDIKKSSGIEISK